MEGSRLSPFERTEGGASWALPSRARAVPSRPSGDCIALGAGRWKAGPFPTQSNEIGRRAEVAVREGSLAGGVAVLQC